MKAKAYGRKGSILCLSSPRGRSTFIFVGLEELDESKKRSEFEEDEHRTVEWRGKVRDCRVEEKEKKKEN